MDHSSQIDRELVIAYREGDQLAFNEIVKKYTGLVYSIVNTYVANESDDLFQETFIGLSTSILNLRFNNDQPLRNFLCGIARKKVLSRLSKREKEIKSEPLTDNSESHIVSIRTSDESTNEKHDRIQDVVSKFSHDHQVIISLFYYEKMSIAEIAKVFGISSGAMKQQIDRLKNKIRNKLGVIKEKRLTTHKKDGS